MEIVVLVALALFLYWFFTRPKRKGKPIGFGDVVQVQGMHGVDRDLPLGDLGAVCKIGDYRRVQVVFPNLTASGKVDYVYRWYDLKAVRKPLTTTQVGQERLTKATYIAALIEEQVQLEPEIETLKDHCRELDERLRLAKTSEVFAAYIQDFENKLARAKKFLLEADQLYQSSLQFVRELLIGSELEEYDASLRLGDYSILISQYKDLRKEYQAIQTDLESAGYPDLPNTQND